MIRKVLIGIGVLAIVGGIAFYEAVLPVHAGRTYLGRLNAAGKPLHSCLVKVSNTTQANVFNNPDESSAANLQEISGIDATVTSCQNQLKNFDKISHQLSHWPLSGYTSSYHDAEVRQSQAKTIVSQSDDVLRQYRQVTSFLHTYFDYDMTFVQYETAVNNVSNLDTLVSNIGQLENESQVLKQNADKLSATNAPQGYQPLTTAAAAIYRQASDGFATLASGLVQNNDNLKDAGIQGIEAATNTHDSSVEDLPSSLSQNAYQLEQATELPDKITNLFS